MTDKVLRLNPDGDAGHRWKPSGLTEKAAFTTADQSEIICEYFESEDGTVLAGVWECAPCREEIEAYPVNEMMTVVSGAVTLTNADGSSDTFRAGDTFFIAKGTKCVWEINEKLRKYYMIVE